MQKQRARPPWDITQQSFIDDVTLIECRFLNSDDNHFWGSFGQPKREIIAFQRSTFNTRTLSTI